MNVAWSHEEHKRSQETYNDTKKNTKITKTAQWSNKEYEDPNECKWSQEKYKDPTVSTRISRTNDIIVFF